MLCGALTCFLLAPVSFAAEKGVAANPNRPSVSNPADLTAPGYLEIELGWTGAFRSSQYRSQHTIPFLAKLALNDRIQLRLDGVPLQQLRPEEGNRVSGIGDWSPGVQWKFLDQTEARPAMALAAAVKLPAASARKGLGSGKADYALTLLVSKDIEPVHLDLNVAHTWLGREEGGFDRQWLGAFAASLPVADRWTLGGEVYTFSSPTAETPRVVSTLWSLSYAYRPTVVFDLGVDVGLNRAAPDFAILAGVTVTLAKLF
jgi:hypothetical protein